MPVSRLDDDLHMPREIRHFVSVLQVAVTVVIWVLERVMDIDYYAQVGKGALNRPLSNGSGLSQR